jgi:hypothetical protein
VRQVGQGTWIHDATGHSALSAVDGRQPTNAAIASIPQLFKRSFLEVRAARRHILMLTMYRLWLCTLLYLKMTVAVMCNDHFA